MPDLLSLGAQGVYAAGQQLNTTGHNIANTNTQGYSKQNVELQSNDSAFIGGDRWGDGVSIKNVRRNYDKFAQNELNIATSLLAHANTHNAKVSVLDNLMAFSAKKIPDNINGFFAALTALADTPNDMGARKVVLENAKMVTDGFNSVNSILQSLSHDIKEEIKGTVSRMNAIGKELADIQAALVKSGGKDNTLLDKHQALINELSEYTQVTVNQSNDGAYNVLIGTGHTLVSGVEASTLTTLSDSIDSQKLGLALVSGESSKPILSDDIRGRLGALFEYQNETMKKARNEIGLLSISFAIKFNELQAQGYDLYGKIGKAMFNDFNDVALSQSRVLKNSASIADLSVFIEDISELKAGDYQLKYDGTQYTLIDPQKLATKVIATGTPPVIKMDGLSIQINTHLAANERVILRPMEYAAGQISLQLTEPSEIAAQSFITSQSNLFGDAELKILTKGKQHAFQVVISSNGAQFSVLDMQGKTLLAPQAYPPANNINIHGTEFSLSQGAKENDRFVISLVPADGDNSNLLKMQALQTRKILYQGRSTLLDVFEKLNSDIGTQKASFERLESISRAEYDAAQGRVSEISGVNLDEEAANMIKFQQAYMASSRILSAANEVFETLLNATR